MPRPYSTDLRERVVAACESNLRTRREVADIFQISEATVYNWLQRWRTSRSITPAPRAGGRAARADIEMLRQLYQVRAGRSLDECAKLYRQWTGQQYSPSHISRLLNRMKRADGG
jgi:transposase